MSISKYSEKLVQVRPPNSVHRCKICPYFTKSVFLMVNHIGHHYPPLVALNCENSNLEPYSCKNCNFQTGHHIKICHSIKTEHQEQNYKVQPYICKECSFETYLSIKWLQHTTSCSKSKQLKSIRIHKIKIHSEGDRTNGLKWYKCNECEFKSKYRSSVHAHKISKHLIDAEIRWHQCEKCSYKAKQNKFRKARIFTPFGSHGMNAKSARARPKSGSFARARSAKAPRNPILV